MTVTVKHSKTNSITDWTQAQLDEQIALGNFPTGTTLANIVLPSDWNNDHTLTGVGTMAEQNANSVAITGGTINNTTIGATTATTGKFTSVTTPSVTATTNDLTLSAISTGNFNVNTPNGTAFRVLPVSATSSNWLQVGNPSTTVIRLGPAGTTVADFRILAPTFTSFHTGSSADGLSDGSNQMRVSHTASAVNYVQVTGAATGAQPTISAQGSDATVDLSITTKASGIMRLQAGGVSILRLRGQASPVNYFDVYQAATTKTPYFQATGTDSNIGFGILTTGTGAIDLAAGSSGVNISNGGTVTAITRTVAGVSYTSAPSLAISAPTTAGGVQATATCRLIIYGVTVASGGTGYTVGDTLTLVGGTPITTGATYTVATVSSGVVTSVNYLSYNTYSAIPSTPAATTGGTGTGCTLNLTGVGIDSVFTITNAGSGYIEQPTVTFSGGGGSSAAAYATVGSGTIVRGIGSTMDFANPNGVGLRVNSTAISSNLTDYVELSGGASGVTNGVYVRAGGSTTNNSVYIQSKGTGSISFFTNWTTGAAEQFRVSHTASAVNYVQVTGAATGSGPIISTQGLDTNATLTLRSKGTFAVTMQSSAGANIFEAIPTASSVNYLRVAPSIASSAPTLSAQGTDTNIDLALTPKGTGVVRFGTYTANMALTVQGYIEIKDSGGTLRKLAVIA